MATSPCPVKDVGHSGHSERSEESVVPRRIDSLQILRSAKLALSIRQRKRWTQNHSSTYIYWRDTKNVTCW